MRRLPWVAVLLVAGCSRQDQPSTMTREQIIAASFDSLVSAEMTKYEATVGTWARTIEYGGAWTTFGVTIDARTAHVNLERTQSLTSPYIGTLGFVSWHWNTADFPARKDAESAIAHADSSGADHTHTFALQRGRWTMTSSQYRPVDGGEWRDCTDGF